MQCTSREVLTKLGHDYDMDTEIERVASTCGTHGHVNYACKVCGDIKSVELELDPTKHSFEETSSDLQYVTHVHAVKRNKEREFTYKEYNQIWYGQQQRLLDTLIWKCVRKF